MGKSTLVQNQDERYSVVEEAIHGAFTALMKEKKIEKITVADVVKRAGIVRSTFYNHYDNIPALEESAQSRTVNEIFKLLETFHPKNDREFCRSFYLTICDYAKNNPFLTEPIKNLRGDAFMEKAMTMFHRYVTNVMEQSQPSQKHSKEVVSYAIACSIGSTLGVLHKWATEEYQTPAETVADILTEAFMAGTLPLIL